MNILIFGNGQVGNFYHRHYSSRGYNVNIASTVDITDIDQVERAVEEFSPDVVINTAAKTSLEWCGNNKLQAFNVNVLGAGNIARACDRRDVYLVHFSSGCIFSSISGTDAKTESSLPNPASYYGWTKVWSEEIVTFERSPKFRCLILRPRQPVSAEVNPKNMLVKMLTFSKFVDTPNSGTVIEDLMAWTDVLVDREATGVYHVANVGYTTPFKIGEMIRDHILRGLEPQKISKEELDLMTPNIRVDTVLDVEKLQSLVEVSPYEDRLHQIIVQLAEHLAEMDASTLKKTMEQTARASRERTRLNEVYASLYEGSLTTS